MKFIITATRSPGRVAYFDLLLGQLASLKKTATPEIVQQNVVFDVGWDSVSKRCVPIDSTGWQFTQTRGIVAVQTSSGSVCLIPMGMAHGSLVTFELEL